MNKIVIVDYGMGNLRSVYQALRKVAPDAAVSVSGRVADIDSASRIVLPGQGAMRDCMRALDESGLRAAVLRALTSRPLLGVCVGEQMLFERSEEGDTPALGMLEGQVVRFNLEQLVQADGSRFKVPHMGWTRVRQTVSHPLWNGIRDNAYFYFVHSFYAVPERIADMAGAADYGGLFCCAVAHDNIFATQFHPEKSADAGLQLYRNFAGWQP